MISFDVFDTVLTRTVGHPKAVFLLLGQRLAREQIISLAPERFASARIEAEKQCRRNHPDREITHTEIMDELAVAIDLDPSAKKIIQEYEKALEKELSIPVPGAAKQIANARKRCGKVIFISDMYLPEAFVRELLEFHELWKPGDALYISSTHGVTKANGMLYRLVAKNEGIDIGQLTHFGDHTEADIRVARNQGVRTNFVEKCHLNRFERIMENNSLDTGGLSSAFAGASRMTRLSVPASSKHEVAIRDVAAGVAAPVICAYVLWVLSTARRTGIKRLYFVSRDGQIMRRVARIFTAWLNMDLDLRYFYASRQALHLPSVEEIGPEEREWILESAEIVPIESVLARVGLTLESMRQSIGRDESYIILSAYKNDHSRRSILHRLLDHPGIQARIFDAANSRRAILLDYLRQEGLFDDVRYALVDIGWKGRCQRSLARVLKAAGGPTPTGFYFGLAESQREDVGTMKPFFFDRPRSVGYRYGIDSLEYFMEIFCQADHGSVFGYHKVEDIIKPELNPNANSRSIQWGVPLLHESINCFAKALAEIQIDLSHIIDLRPLSWNLLNAFCNSPTLDEAFAWGNFPYNDDQRDSSFSTLAWPYNALDALSCFRKGKILPKHKIFWLTGAYTQTPRIIRVFMRLALELHDKFRRILVAL